MKTKALLGASLLTMVASVMVVFASEGCGQDVATCGTVCGFADAPTNCTEQCPAEQQALTQAGYEGDFQAYLTCLGNAGTYTATECSSESTTVAHEYTEALAGGVGPIEAGSGVDSAIDAGPGTVAGPCVLGGTCTTSGATCTIPKAGPCDSDERLSCNGASLVADGFPCSSDPGEGCGFGSAAPDACSETCSCVNGLEVCTGDCPDGGPAFP